MDRLIKQKSENSRTTPEPTTTHIFPERYTNLSNIVFNQQEENILKNPKLALPHIINTVDFAVELDTITHKHPNAAHLKHKFREINRIVVRAI